MLSKGAFGLRSGATTTGKKSPARTRTARYSLHLMFLAANLLALTHASFAADTTGAVSRKRMAEFRKTYSITNLRMGKLGVPASIDGALSTGLPPGTPFEQVLAFLERNRDLFKMKDPRSEWVLLRERLDDRTKTRHLRLQQMYHGLEVNGIQLTAHFSRTGQLEAIGSSYQPGIDLPSNPTVGKDEARRVVAQAVGSADSLVVSKNDLLVFPWEGKYFLAWQIWASPGGEYFIDALTGDVIYHWSNVYDMPEGVGGGFREIPPPAPEPVKPLPESNWVPPPVPAGELPDSLRRGMESQPGSPTGEMHPVHGGPKSDSLHKGHGWLVLPPDLLPTPADTSSEKPGARDVDQEVCISETTARLRGCDLRSRTAEGRH